MYHSWCHLLLGSGALLFHITFAAAGQLLQRQAPGTPSGTWGMAQDVPEDPGAAFLRNNYIHLSSRVTSMVDNQGNAVDLHDPNVLTDQMMIRIAHEAFAEMVAALPGLGLPPNRWPGALAVLEVDGELFLSSSIKSNRGGFAMRFNSPVSLDLMQCSVTVTDDFDYEGDNEDHKFSGNCAEPAAAALFYNAHPDWEGQNNGQLPDGTRVITVGPNNSIKPACDELHWPRWGCRSFISHVAMRDIARHESNEALYPAGWVPQTAPTCLEP